jgi:hypothetical protein
VLGVYAALWRVSGDEVYAEAWWYDCGCRRGPRKPKVCTCAAQQRGVQRCVQMFWCLRGVEVCAGGEAGTQEGPRKPQARVLHHHVVRCFELEDWC